MTQEIEYYFTPLSGFAYLGHDRLKHIAAQASADVLFRPMTIASVFEASGTAPPAKQSPARLAYRRADMRRWAERISLPLNVEPKHWPAPDALAGKCIVAAGLTGSDPWTAARAFFEGVWVRDADIANVQDAALLLGEAGLDASAILEAAQSEEAAGLLKSYTQEAISKGVFGSPSYVLNGDVYWGQDRLSFVAGRLGLPVQPTA